MRTMQTTLAAAVIGCLVGLCGAAPADLPVTDGLELWLDACDSSTISDTNGVNPDAGSTVFDYSIVVEWRDKSGHNRHATAVASNAVYYSYDNMNGRPTLAFSLGDPSQIKKVHLALADSVTTAEETAFVVTRMYDNGDNRGGWLGSASTYGVLNDSNRYVFYTTSGGVVTNDSAPTNYTIVVFNRDASHLLDVYENGVQVATDAAGANGDLVVAYVGRYNPNPTTPRYFYGEISEIVLYSRSLSVEEMNRVGAYLEKKYGLAGAYADYGSLSVTNGLVTWYDAVDTVTVADKYWNRPGYANFNANGVWTWGEKSGDPRVAVAVNESEPKYLIADMNGRPTLYFDSTNYLYTTDGTLADFTVTTSNETAFFMTRMYDNGNNRGGWFGKADAWLGFQNDNDRYFLHSDSGSASAAESAPTADTIVVYHRDAADDKTDVYENGVRVLHNLPNALGNLAGMNAIARINNRNIWGEIAEILLYDRPLSDDEMYSVGKYLSLKYGLKTAYIRGTVIVVR